MTAPDASARGDPSSSPLARVAAALEAHGCGPVRNGRARCPAHEDRNPSLGVGEGADGRVLLTCRTGCAVDDVVAALGLAMADLFPRCAASERRSTGRPRPDAPPTVEDLGSATDAQRDACIRERRVTRPDALERVGARHVRVWGGEWLAIPALAGRKVWGIYGDGRIRRDAEGRLERRNVGPVSVVLSPDLAAARGNGHAPERLWDLEGESDWLAWIDVGGVAALAGTGGAGSLAGHDRHRGELVELARDAEVVVVRDLDDPGRAGARKAAEWWLAAGVPVRVLELPAELGPGGDVRDFLIGTSERRPLGDVADLDGLADATPRREPNAGDADEGAPDVDVADLALDLDAIRARPRGSSPLPGLLPEEPSLVVLVARPKAGKTRLATTIAQAAAAGVAPWPGPPDRSPALELGPVAVVTAEETGADMVRMLDGLALLAQPQRDRERWETRLRLYARDPALDPRVAPILRLDPDGFALLRPLARTCGLVVVDSLSRIKPPHVEEIDNDAMTALLDELHRIATEERSYVLLLHHEGHADRDDPVSAGRGASAISAVARAVWHLDRIPGEPTRRRLRVRGNAVADAELLLEVAGPDAQPEGALLYWRPVDPLGGVALEDVLPEVGSESSTRDLARAFGGCDADEEPSGRARREAALLRERWRREGLVEVFQGPRRALMMRRIR